MFLRNTCTSSDTHLWQTQGHLTEHTNSDHFPVKHAHNTNEAEELFVVHCETESIVRFVIIFRVQTKIHIRDVEYLRKQWWQTSNSVRMMMFDQ
jgi:hypothetical protein